MPPHPARRLSSPTVTEPASYLDTTADAYGAVADLYLELARGQFDRNPLDAAILTAFADHVRGTGIVAELGCGPGSTTAWLRDLGLDVFGVDLSPAMIDLARKTFPGLRFEVGSMSALDLPDAGLAGIASWFSIIHAPPAEVPGFFAEFARTLAPGGHLLLGFFDAEDGPVAPFDHRVTTAYTWPIDELAELAAGNGFTEVGRMLRAARPDERPIRHGHLLLRAAT